MIIDPKVFYLISVLSGLKIALVCLFVALVVITIFLFIFIALAFDDKERAVYIKILPKILFALVCSVILYVVIPSEKTSYTMLVAKYTTYENLEFALEQIKQAVDYIMTLK